MFQFNTRSREPFIPRNKDKLVEGWISAIGLDPSAYGTHSLRRAYPWISYPMQYSFEVLHVPKSERRRDE